MTARTWGTPVDGPARAPVQTRECFVSRSQQQRDQEPKKSLGTFGLFSLLFIGTVGGAYGLEDCLRLGGPHWTVIGILVVPWLWGMPAALAVAELATSIPSNAGPIMWVAIAYPQWLSTACALWTATLDIVDNSLYPSLFADYLSRYVALSPPLRLFAQAALVAACAAANVLGVENLGRSGAAVAVLALVPFALLCVSEGARANFDTDVEAPPTVSLFAFLPMLAWNFSGFDNAGHVVEEVAVPGRTLSRSLILLLGATQLVYLLPVLAGINAAAREPLEGQPDLSFSKWRDGYWVTVAEASGGPVLGGAMVAGGMISASGFALAALCTTSRALQGLTTLGCLPERVSAFLAPLHPRYRTPVAAITVNAAVTFIASASLRFETLVATEQVLYGLRLFLVLGACLRLRARHPTLVRPYRIPVRDNVLALLLLPPLVFCGTVVCLGMFADRRVLTMSAVFIVGGLVAGCVVSARGGMTCDGRIATVPDDEQATGTPRTPAMVSPPMLAADPPAEPLRPPWQVGGRRAAAKSVDV
eukprot:TRINITY_DN33039_c0_g1_i1.p1 TRINITY_DN33039_c0_g1~~TRINITY_DN33039_c0_g1_i1.p1  ORF type:complete len:550 (+),score=160.40 TRINITY_DN33039_c0_g1_i1:56-1651(+)